MEKLDIELIQAAFIYNLDLSSVIVIGCSVAGIAGLALAGYCWYK